MSRSNVLRLLIGLILLSACATVHAQGKLSSLREKMTAPKPKEKSSSSSSSHKHDDEDDDDDDDTTSFGIFFSSDGDCHDDGYHHHHHDHDDDSDGFLAKVFLGAVTSPFWLPVSALERDNRTETNFASFPYNHNQDGYLMFDTLEQDANRDDHWAIRLRNEYGTDFNGLDRYGGRLMLDTSSRIGIDTEWNRWMEDIGSTTDELWMGDINLIYRFAESEHAQFRAGLGWNWLQDDYLGHQNGFNFTYGFDLFPAEPFVIETTLDLGRIDSSTLVHVRSTAGVVWEHVELFAGYDFRKLDSVNLSGFVTGVTLWW